MLKVPDWAGDFCLTQIETQNQVRLSRGSTCSALLLTAENGTCEVELRNCVGRIRGRKWRIHTVNQCPLFVLQVEDISMHHINQSHVHLLQISKNTLCSLVVHGDVKHCLFTGNGTVEILGSTLECFFASGITLKCNTIARSCGTLHLKNILEDALVSRYLSAISQKNIVERSFVKVDCCAAFGAFHYSFVVCSSGAKVSVNNCISSWIVVYKELKVNTNAQYCHFILQAPDAIVKVEGDMSACCISGTGKVTVNKTARNVFYTRDIVFSAEYFDSSQLCHKDVQLGFSLN